LLATLDQKRLQIRSIANSHVKEPLNFLLKYSQVLKSDVIEDIIFWRVILEDLVAYNNQIPNNNIQKLEQFLSVNLQSMSVGDCKIVSNSGPSGDASYFLQKLQEISIATVGGCKRIENAEVRTAYNKFASRFNTQFVGRSPFSIDPKLNSAGPVLDPRSLVRLFRDFDDSMNRGMGDPSYWPAGEKTTNIIGFLNQFDEAVSIIRPGIIGDPNNARMVYEVTPTFRVLRDREAGGDQIIDWSMTVGDQSVRFTDQKRMLVWETGKPIKFKFRWAKNSESVPVSDDKNNNQFSSGKDLTLVFDGSWSLFTLLRKNGKLNTEASAYNLQFNIPISKKSEDDKTASEPYGIAKIFVALKLTVNGETIKLPRFPGRAPTASF
jgi:type VI secretion system protein ImpL